MKLSEIIDRVLVLARTIEEHWRSERAKRYPNCRFVAIPAPELATFPRHPARLELREFIAGLPPATIYMLAMLLDIGRGIYDTEDLLASYADESDQYPAPRSAVDYLLSKPLDYYLPEGLRCLAEDGINVDRLLEG